MSESEAPGAAGKTQESAEIDLSISLPEITGEEFTNIVEAGSGFEPHTVDLTEYTCTCRDWQNARSEYPQKDARRACKHIACVLGNPPHSDKLTGLAHLWCMESIEGDEGIPVFTELKAFKVGDVCVTISKSTIKGRVDVLGHPGYVRRERPYSLYSYDLESRQWNYGQAPDGGDEIERLILSNFEAPVTKEKDQKNIQVASESLSLAAKDLQMAKRLPMIASLIGILIVILLVVLIFAVRAR